MRGRKLGVGHFVCLTGERGRMGVGVEGGVGKAVERMQGAGTARTVQQHALPHELHGCPHGRRPLFFYISKCIR